MKYDEERERFVIDEDRALPVMTFRSEEYTFPSYGGKADGKTQHTRQVIVAFENGWALSILWGDMTYSSNHDTMFSFRGPDTEFTEEPTAVEVGIFSPAPKVIPEVTIENLPGLGDPIKMPEIRTHLWGDPLGYINADQLWWLAMDQVSKWNSHEWLTPMRGPDLESASDTGPYMLTIEIAEDRIPIILDPPTNVLDR